MEDVILIRIPPQKRRLLARKAKFFLVRPESVDRTLWLSPQGSSARNRLCGHVVIIGPGDVNREELDAFLRDHEERCFGSLMRRPGATQFPPDHPLRTRQPVREPSAAIHDSLAERVLVQRGFCRWHRRRRRRNIFLFK